MTILITLLATVAGATLEMAAADVHLADSKRPESLATRYNRLRSHSAWFDAPKPTPHPTTRDYFNSYGNYGSNVKHPHHYFYEYEWPDYRDSYSPTTSPTDGSIIPTYVPTASPQRARQRTNQPISTSRPTSTSPSLGPTRTSSPSGTWNVLAHEHFLDGFGLFEAVESQDIHHYSSTLGREGVVQLQKSASLPSYDIAVDVGSSQLKIVFSFFANSMEIGEGFCLEYSINDESEWNPVRCWQSSIDFENSKWHDNFNVELSLDDRIQVDSLRIKFESIASGDNVDVMFDRISLLQLR